MKLHRNTLLASVAGIGVATMLATAASAAPVRVQDAAGGVGIFASGALFSTANISTDGGATFSTINAGAFGLELSSASPTFPSGSFSSFVTYCFEIGQFIGTLPTTYEQQSLAATLALNSPASATPSATAIKIARLWHERFAASVSETDTNFDGVTNADSATRGAAFQVALWDLAVDGGDGLSNGTFRSDGASNFFYTAIVDLATKYIAIANDSSLTTIANLAALYDPDRQNLIRELGGSSTTDDPVPAPATLALFGAGLIGLAAMRRKKNA